MADLHVVFDSLVGYLIGMALVETILKPFLVKVTKKTLKTVDESMNDALPDWLYLPSEKEYDC
jgi:hypothetical protein